MYRPQSSLQTGKTSTCQISSEVRCTFRGTFIFCLKWIRKTKTCVTAKVLPASFHVDRVIDMPAVANQTELITSIRVCNKLSLFNAHALIAFWWLYFNVNKVSFLPCWEGGNQRDTLPQLHAKQARLYSDMLQTSNSELLTSLGSQRKDPNNYCVHLPHPAGELNKNLSQITGFIPAHFELHAVRLM